MLTVRRSTNVWMPLPRNRAEKDHPCAFIFCGQFYWPRSSA
jgi:hypothetical protein